MYSFRARLLVAALLMAAVTWVYRGGNQELKTWIEPVLSYATKTDYDLLGWGKSLLRLGWPGTKAVTTSSFNLPCSYRGIVRHFGWYYSPQTGKQAFNPGVILRIDNGTPVYPVLEGRVTDVSLLENGYQVTVKHGQELVSVVRGLREVRVKKGELVKEDTVVGKGSEMLYLEIQSKDGPINPENLLSLDGSL